MKIIIKYAESNKLNTGIMWAQTITHQNQSGFLLDQTNFSNFTVILNNFRFLFWQVGKNYN